MISLQFRVWNKIDGVMIDKPNSPRVVDGVLVWDEDDIIMQYTGLNDKNGVKIFEGDIVVDRSVHHQSPEAVEREAWGNWSPFGWDELEVCDPERCEVIGNIFANPELLEGKEGKC